MIKADIYLLDTLKEIQLSGCIDQNPRPKYKDGEEAYSKFITQVVFQYDLDRGEFPIPTLRKTAIKKGIEEILTIYQSQTNTEEGFLKNKVDWWGSWMNEEGNLGKAYSYNLESHRDGDLQKNIVKVKKRLIDPKYFEKEDLEKYPILPSIDGKKYCSTYNKNGEYIIIDRFIKDNITYVECQFLATGYRTIIRESSIKRGQSPVDNRVRSLLNIGYLDNHTDINIDKKLKKVLHKVWTRMMRRCYDGTRKEYDNIFVHNRWHSFRNFLEDVRYIPQYHLAKEEGFEKWSLDKDYYSSNGYSKDTCVFLRHSENVIYRSTQPKCLKIVEGDEEYYEINRKDLAQKLNISKSSMGRNVKKGSYKNLYFEELENDVDYAYRYEISKNQVNELLYNLKENPYSRIHILSLWNWGNMDKKQLVECAFLSMFSVRGEYIDLTLVLRSSDFVVAGFINQIQYVALLLMICGHLKYHTGIEYKPGNFMCVIQNCHTYLRHENAVKELIERKPLNIQPTIELKEAKNFYDYTVNDFVITGVKGIKDLSTKLELAI